MLTDCLVSAKRTDGGSITVETHGMNNSTITYIDTKGIAKAIDGNMSDLFTLKNLIDSLFSAGFTGNQTLPAAPCPPAAMMPINTTQGMGMFPKFECEAPKA